MAMTPTPRVAIITVVATLAYLGLAILGWGSFAAFFSHPPLIALVIVGLVLTGVALFSGGCEKKAANEPQPRIASPR